MRRSVPFGQNGPGSPWPPSNSSSPLPPKISLRLLLEQFWADVYGKEVQSAATYSYTWLADQVGHICLGILLDFGFTVITYRLGGGLGWPTLWAEFLGFFLTMAVVAFWEYRAFRSDVERATGPFPLDRTLLPEKCNYRRRLHDPWRRGRAAIPLAGPLGGSRIYRDLVGGDPSRARMASPKDHLAESRPAISLPISKRAPHDPRTGRRRAAETRSIGRSAARRTSTGHSVRAGSVWPNLAGR